MLPTTANHIVVLEHSRLHKIQIFPEQPKFCYGPQPRMDKIAYPKRTSTKMF